MHDDMYLVAQVDKLLGLICLPSCTRTPCPLSINGSFAIRKGSFKFIFCPGSGGWSYPRPSKKETQGLPKFQLYNLDKDPEEKNNLYGRYAKIESELIALFSAAIKNGRTTPGEPQRNCSSDLYSKEWDPLTIIKNK